LNSRCCLCAPDQTAGGGKADAPAGFLPGASLIKTAKAGTSKSTELGKKQIPGRKREAEQKES